LGIAVLKDRITISSKCFASLVEGKGSIYYAQWEIIKELLSPAKNVKMALSTAKC